MTFLLDTHIWLWNLLEPDKLKQKVTEVLQNPKNELFISPITIWETLILAEKQRIKFYSLKLMALTPARGNQKNNSCSFHLTRRFYV